MENQHRQIKGYRELIPEEVSLMNRIKEAGQVLINLQAELAGRLETDLEVKRADARRSVAACNAANDTRYNEYSGASDECIEFRRFEKAEPLRWASIGKTDIQTGVMALVRAVAQPSVG